MSKVIKTESEQKLKDKNEKVDLKSFIEKKKIQNDALKKIIKKLNSSFENNVEN
jgi:hypothetical protein